MAEQDKRHRLARQLVDLAKDGIRKSASLTGMSASSIELCTAAIKMSPALSAAYQARSIAFGRERQWENAVYDVTVAIQIESASRDKQKLSSLLALRSQYLRAQQRNWEAVRDLLVSIQHDSENVARVLELAQLLFALKKYSKAWLLARTAATCPDRSYQRLTSYQKGKLFSLLGRCELVKGNPERAEASFSQALEFDDAPGIQNEWAVAQFQMGQFASAAASFQCASASSNQNHHYLRNVGLCDFQRGLFTEALSIFDDCISQERSDPALFVYRATTELKLGKYNDAERDVKAALALDPSCSDAHYVQGVLLQETARWSESVQALEKSVQLKNKRMGALHPLFSLGVSYHMVGDLFRALECLSTVVEQLMTSRDSRPVTTTSKPTATVPPSHVRYLHLALKHLGLVYLDLTYFDLAERFFSEALEHNPRCAELYYLRGAARISLGKAEAALQDFRCVLSARITSTAASARIPTSVAPAGNVSQYICVSTEQAMVANGQSSVKQEEVLGSCRFPKLILYTAIALSQLRRFEEAVQILDRTISPASQGSSRGQVIGESDCCETGKVEVGALLLVRGICNFECGSFNAAERDAEAALKSLEHLTAHKSADEQVLGRARVSTTLGISPPLFHGWEPLYLRGLSRCARQKYEEALEDFRLVIRQNPAVEYESDFCYLVGMLCAKTGDYPTAEDFLTRVADSSSASSSNIFHTRALHERAKVRQALQNLEAASSDFSLVLVVEPENINALFRRAFALKAIGKYLSAARDMEAARRINSCHPLCSLTYRDMYEIDFVSLPESDDR